MKKFKSIFLLAVVILPLIGFVSAVTLLVGIKSAGSFDFFPGLVPGIKVFLAFCGASLFLIAIRFLIDIIRKLWTKNRLTYRIAVYLIGGTLLYGAFLLFDWIVKNHYP